MSQPGKAANLGMELMQRADALKEKLETQRDEARAEWVHRAKGVHQPSTVTMQTLLEIDDARRSYVIAQARLDGAMLLWIGLTEIYEMSHQVELMSKARSRTRRRQ